MSERLAEIEARVEAATAGEWVEDGTIFGPDGEECDARTADYEDWVTFKTRLAQADRELWIEARSDIPWLLEREKKLREALAYYAERRNHTTDHEGTPHLWANDSYDDKGPGARARAALADSGEASGEAG